VDISKGDVALAVQHSWANLYAVRLLIRENPAFEIAAKDDSHLIFGKVLDGTHPHGVWIELRSEPKQGETLGRGALLIPWYAILAIGLTETLTPELWQSPKRVGFENKG